MKRHFFKFLLLALVICVGVVGIRMVSIHKFNTEHQLITAEKEEFSFNGQENLYTKNLWPDEAEDDLHFIMETYFPFWVGNASEKGFLSNIITLDFPVAYYQRQGNSFVLAYEIPAHTKIVFNNKGDDSLTTVMAYPGYSVYSFPTLKAGWRYVRPFDTVDADGTVTKSSELYYVSLGTLEKVFECVYQENEEVFRQAPSTAQKTDEEIKRMYLLFADRIFYNNGVYFSRDIYHPYFDTANILLLSASGVLLIAYIVLRVRRRKP